MKTSRFCLGLWKANWLPIGLFFLANIIAFTIAPLILGYQMRWFFDSITLDEPQLKTALALVIWMVILAIARMGFMLTRSVFHELTRYVVGTMLRRNILNNILQRRGVRSLGTSSGDVISRFRDDVDLVLQFIHTVGYFGSFFLFCLFGFIVMLAINPVVTWVVILPFLLISVLVTLIKPRIQRLMAKQRDTTARVTGFIGSTFNGIEVIQSAGAEKAVVEEFRQRNQARRQAVVGHQIFSAFIDYLGGSMYFIGMATFLAIAAAPMRNGDFSVGEFALFAHFISYLGAGMRGLTMILVEYKGLAVVTERLESTLTEPQNEELVTPLSPAYTEEGVVKKHEAIETAPRDSFQIFSARDLGYTYPQSSNGISGINLKIHAGELIVITGEVGSGKTTLLRCLLGHLPLDQGTLFWNEQEVSDPTAFFQPERCAYTPQQPQLFSDSLEANLLQGSEISDEKKNHALNQAVFFKELDRLDQGWQTQVGPSGVKLSGGQVQRAGLARMFMKESSLLVADSPTRALDSETESQFWKGLELKKDQAALFTSSNKTALEKAHRILLLKKGHLLDTGTLPELLKRSNEMKMLWQRQKGKSEQS